MKTKDEMLEINEFKEFMDEGFTVIDIRPPHEFANGFIPSALNIPFYRADTFIELLKKFIEKDRSFLLVDDETVDFKIFDTLYQKGYKHVKGLLNGGMQNWENSGNRLDMVISPDLEEFLLDFKHDDEIRLIDIRKVSDYEISHIEKAENVPMIKLINDIHLLLDGKIYYMYCQDGISSMTTISYLKMHNKHNFYYLNGGFDFLKEQEGITLVSTS